MTYYKVIFENNGCLLSAVALSCSRVVYKENQWVYAPAFLEEEGYGLFVFWTLEGAVNFKNSCFDRKRLVIWECEVENVMPTPKYRLNMSAIANGKIIHSNGIEWPKDTVVVDAVKLTRRSPLQNLDWR